MKKWKVLMAIFALAVMGCSGPGGFDDSGTTGPARSSEHHWNTRNVSSPSPKPSVSSDLEVYLGFKDTRDVGKAMIRPDGSLRVLSLPHKYRLRAQVAPVRLSDPPEGEGANPYDPVAPGLCAKYARFATSASDARLPATARNEAVKWLRESNPVMIRLPAPQAFITRQVERTALTIGRVAGYDGPDIRWNERLRFSPFKVSLELKDGSLAGSVGGKSDVEGLIEEGIRGQSWLESNWLQLAMTQRDVLCDLASGRATITLEGEVELRQDGRIPVLIRYQGLEIKSGGK